MKSSRNTAFSLIELMVAAAIFAILAVLLTSLVGVTTQLIGATTKRLTALEEARFAVDRLVEDLSRSPRSPLLPILVARNDGNDRLSFYSSVRAFGASSQDQRGLSLVEYRVQQDNSLPDAPQPVLQRGARSLDWRGGNEVSMTTDWTGADLPDVADQEFQTLAAGVFRLEITFISQTNGLPTVIPSNQLAEADALLVAIAVIDPGLTKLVPDGTWNTLISAFPNASEGQYPLKVWNDVKQSEALSFLPPPVRNNIHIYQRIIPLPRLP